MVIQSHLRLGIEPPDPSGPVGADQPIDTALIGRDAQAQTADDMAPTQRQVTHPVLPASHTKRKALRILGVTADNVDHPQKGARAVGRRVGAAQYLDFTSENWFQPRVAPNSVATKPCAKTMG